VTALTALAASPSRAAQLSKTRACCRRWIDAIESSERGPLWEVLSHACDDAEILGLNDEAFQTFVKNAKRYHRYLHDHDIPETLAFDKQIVRGYQKHVATLRKTRSVPPAQPGKPLTYKTKPEPRAATENEPRLKIGTLGRLPLSPEAARSSSASPNEGCALAHSPRSYRSRDAGLANGCRSHRAHAGSASGALATEV
jgi:hypothetical protein